MKCVGNIGIIVTGCIVISMLFVMLFVISNVKSTFAFPVPVTLTIDRLQNLNLNDPYGPDFYPMVTIDGQEFRYTYAPSEGHDISPGWNFTKIVDSNVKNIPISIAIWDYDTGLTGEDDWVDISIGQNERNLNLNLRLAPCAFTGGENGPSAICGFATSWNGIESDSAIITFHINAQESRAPGLGIECLHTPIWPQRTDTISINATALDGNLLPNTLADSIHIWTATGLDTPRFTIGSSGSNFTHNIGRLNSGQFTYGCFANDGAERVFSGWKVGYVGLPPEGRGIPVVFTANRSNAIDIAFIPDSNDYTGPTDPTFQTAVQTIIKAYYRENGFYNNQHMMNFWITQDLGTANAAVLPTATTPGSCPHVRPPNWSTDYTFAEAGAIVHSTPFQDCATPPIFSGDLISGPRVFLHETGHQPFGLFDEYCCNGGYWENRDFGNHPNVYESLASCNADRVVPTAVCRTWIEASTGKSWFTSDPTPNDLMVDNLTPQPLDTRRINTIFNWCSVGKC